MSSQETPFRFCGGCGRKDPENRNDHRFSCPECGWLLYKSPVSATVAILELPDGRIILTRRGLDPGAGALDLPGGFVDPGESAEEATCRELDEELALKLSPPNLSPLFTFPNQYLFSGVLYHTVDLFFHVPIPDIPEIGDANEITELVVLPPCEIDLSEIAFSSIRRGLEQYITTLLSR